MEDSKNSLFLSLIFLFFLLFLVIGGFILTKNIIGIKEEKETKKETTKIKIDSKKDYIYYDNIESFSMEPDIVYKDVIINITGAEIINSTLKKENTLKRQTVEYIKDHTLDKNKVLLYEESTIYKALERDYKYYKNTDYLSLLIYDYEYNCYDGPLITNVFGYNINLNSGKFINDEVLISNFGLTKDDILLSVKDYLEENQIIENEVAVIDIEKSLKELFELKNYSYYVMNNDLYITFIVKTNFIDYNDSVKLS